MVLNSVTHRPIARVLVELPGVSAPSVLTDRDGRFSFAEVPLGPKTIVYHRPGYYDSGSEQPRASASLTVTQDTPEQALLLEPAAALEGQLLLSDGEIPEGLRVGLLHAQVIEGRRRWQQEASARVHADGSFAFEGLRAGSYLVHAEASLDPAPPDVPLAVRSGYAPAYAPEARDAAAASIFKLLPGQTAAPRMRLTRVPFYPVRIHVDGQAAASSFLFRGGAFTNWPARYNRSDGTVTAELPDGDYMLTGRQFERDRQMLGALPVHVSGAPVLGPAITLAGANPVHAAFSGPEDASNPSGNQRSMGLTLIPANPDSPDQQQIGVSDGAQGTTLLSPGSYWVSPGGTGKSYVSELSMGGTDLLAEPVTIAAGASMDFSITLRDDSGEITASREGEALAQPCFLQLIPLSARGRSFVARAGSQEASTTFSALAPGDYLLLATSSHEAIAFREPGVLQQLKGTRVTVSPGGAAKAMVDKLFDTEGLP